MTYLRDSVLPIIHFDRKLNNYAFIKYYTDPGICNFNLENAVCPEETTIETKC
jgi:hypothetical protein